MEFEYTVRMFLGERAYGIAGSEGSPKYRAQWLRKSIQKIAAVIAGIDTTERHRRLLLGEVEAVLANLKAAERPTWTLVYAMLRLIGRLSGYDFVRGARCHSLTYWQDTGQHLNTVVFEGGDVMQDYYDSKNALGVRRTVVRTLREQGHTTYMIAQVLNTSEYQVKKLLHEDPPPSIEAAA